MYWLSARFCTETGERLVASSVMSQAPVVLTLAEPSCSTVGNEPLPSLTCWPCVSKAPHCVALSVRLPETVSVNRSIRHTADGQPLSCRKSCWPAASITLVTIVRAAVGNAALAISASVVELSATMRTGASPVA